MWDVKLAEMEKMSSNWPGLGCSALRCRGRKTWLRFYRRGFGSGPFSSAPKFPSGSCGMNSKFTSVSEPAPLPG